DAHYTYDPLHFVLFHPHGELGWHPNIAGATPAVVDELNSADEQQQPSEDKQQPDVEPTVDPGRAGGRGRGRGRGRGEGRARDRGTATSEPPCTTSSAAAAAAAAAASHKKVDYVHVRARRGQATDSHSLAERVRREKISERMKYLQELVPGCSKVTGKALMLDEIINYVQSLRRQVEFLSMKLASVNSQLDFNLDSILNKELLWSQDSAVLLPEPSLSFGLHLPPLIQQHLATEGPDFRSLATFDTLLCRRTMSAPISVPCAPNADAFGDDPSTRMSTEWDGELQTMFQMGFGQVSRATPLMEGSFNTCQLPAGHMKVEL
ncbi:unnamed protein product, partial [Sphagnum troendelagicum]